MNKNTPNNNSDDAQAAKQNPPAQAANSDALAADETPNDSLSKEQLQLELEKTKREAQGLRKRIREEDQAKQEAEQARLTEQGQYKELAEQSAARVKELEPVEQGYKQLAELVSGQAKEKIKDWPAEVMKLYPGDDTPIEQRLAWIDQFTPLVNKLQIQARGSQPGNAPNPRPSQAPPENSNDVYSKLRSSGKYGA